MAILTDRFAVSAREISAIEGLPDYPFATIPHPIAGNPNAELRGKAEAALGSILSLLTTRKA